MHSSRKMFLSTTGWHHDNIYLDVQCSGFSSEEEAEKFGNSNLSLQLKIVDTEYLLLLSQKTKHGETVGAISCQDVKIQEDQRPPVRPLNPSNPIDLQIIFDSIDDESSPYHITDQDLTDVDWTYEELSKRIPMPCRFSCLSYGAIEQLPTSGN
jgi:hypothetical protein